MNTILRRSLELFTLVGLFVGSVAYIELSNPRRSTPTPIVITDIRATVSETEHAPAAIEKLPDDSVPAVPRRRDPEPPAVQPVVAAAAPVEPVKPAEPVKQPAPNPQPVQQQPQQWQCQPVYQPEQPCRRRGLG